MTHETQLPRAVLLGVTGLALSALAAVSPASAQSCEFSCYNRIIAECTAQNSGTANWWEIGGDFQTCVAFAASQCNATFRQLHPAQGTAFQMDFEPTGSGGNCIVIGNTGN